MRGGGLVTIALPGDDGRACPAVVIQAALFAEYRRGRSCRSRASCGIRHCSASGSNPVRRMACASRRSEVDKTHTLPREKFGASFGRLDDGTMVVVNRALALFLGFAVAEIFQNTVLRPAFVVYG